jgi:hypothetical protein
MSWSDAPADLEVDAWEDSLFFAFSAAAAFSLACFCASFFSLPIFSQYCEVGLHPARLAR